MSTQNDTTELSSQKTAKSTKTSKLKSTKRSTSKQKKTLNESDKIRYAVLGLGYIAQNAVLPAFKGSKENSVLAALVSDSDEKLSKLGKKYKVKALYHYDQLEECIHNENIDAVYIALPNSHHREFSIRAMESGAHVLCEKPLGVNSLECHEMYDQARNSKVYLMTAYRLHFDQANMEVVKRIKEGEIGEPRIFSSVFSFQVVEPNIRLQSSTGGGVLFDLGIYPINAARYIFQDEPRLVYGQLFKGNDPRFAETEGTATGVLRFPKDKIAQFTVSFAAADCSYYEVVGTEGLLRLTNSYDYSEGAKLQMVKNGKETVKSFNKHDQFAAELIYFSDCIIKGREPEPSALEGLADLKVIDALRISSKEGILCSLKSPVYKFYPDQTQIISRPAGWREPQLVDVKSPHLE